MKMKTTGHKVHAVEWRTSLSDGKRYQVGFVRYGGKRHWVWRVQDSFGGGWLRVTLASQFKGIEPS